MSPQKIKKPIYCHSGEGRARSEALALSSDFNRFWTPAFAGVTKFELLRSNKNSELIFSIHKL
jgi:hypothetical protein